MYVCMYVCIYVTYVTKNILLIDKTIIKIDPTGKYLNWIQKQNSQEH